MLSLFVEFFRAYAEALSAIGLVIGAAALTLAGIAFTRSQAFRGYMGGEHKQNLQNFEAMLRGCLDTMHGILLDSKDEERYFRSLEALLVTMSDTLSRYEIYVDKQFRSSVPSLRLALLHSTSAAHAESIEALEVDRDYVKHMLEGLDVPPGSSHPA